MKYLFVGGPADGEWRETAGPGRADKVNIAAAKPIRVCDRNIPLEMFPSMPASIENVLYRIRAWSASDRVIYIYTPDGASDFDSFQQLLKGYKP